MWCSSLFDWLGLVLIIFLFNKVSVGANTAEYRIDVRVIECIQRIWMFDIQFEYVEWIYVSENVEFDWIIMAFVWMN